MTKSTLVTKVHMSKMSKSYIIYTMLIENKQAHKTKGMFIMKNKKNEEKRNAYGVRRQPFYVRKKSLFMRTVGILTGMAIGLTCMALPAFATLYHPENNPDDPTAITQEMLSDAFEEVADTVDGFIKNIGYDETVSMTTVTGTTSSTTTSTSSSSTTTSLIETTSSEKKATTSTTTSTMKTVVSETTSNSNTTSTTVKETTTTSNTTTTTNTTVATTTTTPREYIVYKPSTHYVHKNTCRWFDSTCKEITSTEGLECRKCTECNADIEIINEYVPTQTTTTTTTTQTTVVNNGGHYACNFITDTERVYLCNIVGSEYGADWVSLYDKALVVATVMNRYYDGGWTGGRANTIYNVITAPYQYSTAYAVPYYRYNVTQSCIDAVDYYFMHQSEFPHVTSYWGDGRVNHFR